MEQKLQKGHSKKAKKYDVACIEKRTILKYN